MKYPTFGSYAYLRGVYSVRDEKHFIGLVQTKHIPQMVLRPVALKEEYTTISLEAAQPAAHYKCVLFFGGVLKDIAQLAFHATGADCYGRDTVLIHPGAQQRVKLS